jgi:hypothetical protein
MTFFCKDLLKGFLCCAYALTFFLLISFTTSAQYIASNSVSGSTISILGSGATFTGTPQNLSSADGNSVKASVTLSILGEAETRYLQVTGFNFNIPSNAFISGIKAEIRKKATGISILSNVTDKNIRLVTNNNISGINKKSPDNWQNSYQTSTYGGEEDLWETTLTPEDVNGSGFGIVISTSFKGLAGVLLSAEIDQILMTVYYSMPVVLPVTLHSFDARLANNSVQLNWSLAEQEENGIVTLQRSINNKGYQDIYKQDLFNSTNLHFYQFKDELRETGDYHYRLKMIAATGKITYSPVKTIIYKNNSSLKAFPNPARSWVKVSFTSKVKNFTITNICQQYVQVPMHKLTDHLIQLNVEHLPTGIYFIQAENEFVRFVKNQ